MFSLFIFPKIIAMQPEFDWWFYRGVFIVVDLYGIGFTWRVLSALYYAITGQDPTPRETARVEAMNLAIGHDQQMLSYLGQYQQKWQDEQVQQGWKRLKAREEQLRNELNALGGHEPQD